MERTSGTPQGGVISPVLANMFLHYVFDVWMKRNFPQAPFELCCTDDGGRPAGTAMQVEVSNHPKVL